MWPFTRKHERKLGPYIIVIVSALGAIGLNLSAVVIYKPRPWQTRPPPPELLNALKEIHHSKIVFNPPVEMDQGQAERIEARISYQDIGTAITKNLKGRGLPDLENIEVGQKMTVTLLSDEDEFKIKKYASDEQLVAGKPYAQWEWD